MTEDEARGWVRDRFGAECEAALERFVALLLAESERQNLISAATVAQVWARHIVDSAQLVPLATDAGAGSWIDIGSGPGLPGLVVALLCDRPVALIEPRGRRVEFLRSAAQSLGLEKQVSIVPSRIESFRSPRPAAVISARAVAELCKLFAGSAHCADRSTIWLLPKGRNAQSEVDAARKAWQGTFHVEHSITQPDSLIVIAREVRKR